MVKPEALHRGDEVSIVAPSGPFDRQLFERGLALLSDRYRPVFGPGLFAQERYLAGSDARRLEELSEALASERTRAVFSARGGYGALRLLQRLKLPQRPKLFVGFSDICALHAALQCSGWVSVHGPVLTQLGNHGRKSAEALFSLLEDPSPPPLLQGAPAVAGVAEGPVIGGNLSVVTRLLGTPFFPPADGAILALEDVGERPYRIDRMFQHLKLAGVFERVRGLALGAFTESEEPGGAWTAQEVLAELATSVGLPCAMELPIGHGAVNRPIPLGARAVLDGGAGTLRFLEGAVQ
jgi:muramoyltetrapeptide carboxypeptidase